MPEVTLKPNRRAFVTYALTIGTPIWAIFTIGLFAVGVLLPADAGFARWLMFGGGTAILAFAFWNIITRSAQYRKRSYTLSGTHISITSGGLFDDSQTDLELRNVTHVTLELPWIAYKLFGAGTVRIESAGASTSEVKLYAINEPERVYGIVLMLLRQNGFSLSSQKSLIHTTASRTGAIIDLFSMITGGLFILFWAGTGLIPVLLISPMLALLAIPVLALAGFFLYASYRNNMSKTYTVTEDAITYEEGFLTRRRAVIPAENLSDSHVNEPFVKRFFGIADVAVSCQGVSAEIRFANLSDAERFNEAVDLIASSQQPQEAAPARSARTPAPAREHGRMRRPSSFEPHFFKPSLKPTLIRAGVMAIVALPILFALIAGGFFISGVFIVLVFPLFVFAAVPTISIIREIIMRMRTTYTLDRNSVRSEWSVLSREQKTFTDDRLTSITITRTPLDRIIGTMSVRFSSIGSGEQLVFEAVPLESGALDAIAEKYGLSPTAGTRYPVQPTAGRVSRAGFFATCMAFFLGAVSLAFTPFVPLVPIITISALAGLWAMSVVFAHLAYKNAYLSIDDQILYERHGWITVQETYVGVDDIKGITATKYPMGTDGAIAFNVAGDTITGSGKNRRLVTNAIRVPYLPDVFALSDELSRSIDVFAPPSEPRFTAKVDPAPLVATGIGISIVLFFLLPLVIPATIVIAMRAARTTYAIEEHRIVQQVRFLYETRTALFYDRIDHLSNRRGMLDKLFDTGSIIVNTTGSSMIEMMIGPIKEYDQVRETLSAAYQGKKQRARVRS